MTIAPSDGSTPRFEPLLLSNMLIERWLPTIEQTIRPTTFASYKTHVYRHVLPMLGGSPIEDLDAARLNALHASLLSSGLSPATVQRVHATLRRALRDAVRWGLLTANPAADADPPRDRSRAFKEMRTWSRDELRTFLMSTRQDPFYELWFLLAMTGLRRGEALGLRWRDIDLEASHLSVRQTFVTVGHQVQRSLPKSARGQRVVALDDATVRVLKGFRELRSSESRDPLVFSPDGSVPFHPTAITKRFNRSVGLAEVPRIRLHDLRHTHATLALQAGIHSQNCVGALGPLDGCADSRHLLTLESTLAEGGSRDSARTHFRRSGGNHMIDPTRPWKLAHPATSSCPVHHLRAYKLAPSGQPRCEPNQSRRRCSHR